MKIRIIEIKKGRFSIQKKGIIFWSQMDYFISLERAEEFVEQLKDKINFIPILHKTFEI